MNEAAKILVPTAIGILLVCVQARVSQHFCEFELVNRESVRSALNP